MHRSLRLGPDLTRHRLLRVRWRPSSPPPRPTRVGCTYPRRARSRLARPPRRSRRLGRDAYDTALAESFVACFKTELIADRVWKTRSQLELAVVEYIGWFNHDRLHQALGDIPPAELEQRHSQAPSCQTRRLRRRASSDN